MSWSPFRDIVMVVVTDALLNDATVVPIFALFLFLLEIPINKALTKKTYVPLAHWQIKWIPVCPQSNTTYTLYAHPTIGSPHMHL